MDSNTLFHTRLTLDTIGSLRATKDPGRFTALHDENVHAERQKYLIADAAIRHCAQAVLRDMAAWYEDAKARDEAGALDGTEFKAYCVSNGDSLRSAASGVNLLLTLREHSVAYQAAGIAEVLAPEVHALVTL